MFPLALITIAIGLLAFRQYLRRQTDHHAIQMALEDAKPGKTMVVSLWHHHDQGTLLADLLTNLSNRNGRLLWHTWHHELGPSVPRHRLAFVVGKE